MYYKRSWTTFGICVLIAGLTLVGLGVMFASMGIKEGELLPLSIMMLLGIALSVAGIWVLVWHLKDKLKNTGGKVDKNQEYVFTLVSPEGESVVTEYSQIESALKLLEQTKQGMVTVKIEPPLANIMSVDCSYKNGYFYTYFLQKREDGEGYWFSVSDTTHNAMRNIKLLFVKHKKIDFEGMNRLETGKGR